MVVVAENNYEHMCTRFRGQNTGNFIKIIKIHQLIIKIHQLMSGGGEQPRAHVHSFSREEGDG